MASKTYLVCVEGSDISFPCKEDEFVLAAMKRAGCGPIHHGCFGGGCGVCKMRLVDGEVEIVKRMSRAHVSLEEEEMGYLLTCCVQPRSNLTVATVPAVG